MATSRFKKIVQEQGQPETLLLFGPPLKDKKFTAAIQAHQIMSISIGNQNGKKEYGEVGYRPGKNMTYLRFPKSLKKYKGNRIVGIDFDLIKDTTIVGTVPVRSKEESKPLKSTQAPKPKISFKTFNVIIETVTTYRAHLRVQAGDEAAARQDAWEQLQAKSIKWKKSSSLAHVVDVEQE